MDSRQFPSIISRGEAMKTDLTVKLIKTLTLDQMPVGIDSKGHLVFADNFREIKGNPL
jgi:hypothetical protein